MGPGKCRTAASIPYIEPSARAPVATAADLLPASGGMRGKRILFYDPDPRAVRVAERALTATGSEVVTAVDADDLIAKVESDVCQLMMINYDPTLRDDPRWADRLGTIEHRWPRTKLDLHSTAPTEDYLPLMASHKFL